MQLLEGHDAKRHLSSRLKVTSLARTHDAKRHLCSEELKVTSLTRRSSCQKTPKSGWGARPLRPPEAHRLSPVFGSSTDPLTRQRIHQCKARHIRDIVGSHSAWSPTRKKHGGVQQTKVLEVGVRVVNALSRGTRWAEVDRVGESGWWEERREKREEEGVGRGIYTGCSVVPRQADRGRSDRGDNAKTRRAYLSRA